MRTVVGLNELVQEAKDFLAGISDAHCSPTEIIAILNEEFELLKGSTGNKEQLCHQVYDVLFLLFELAAVCEFDLDIEWKKGREKKNKKYLGKE